MKANIKINQSDFNQLNKKLNFFKDFDKKVLSNELGRTALDISRLAKLNHSAVICEVMNENGRMARFSDLIKFSKKHRIKIASIEDLISYRVKNEKFIFNTENKVINFKKYQNFILKTYINKLDQSYHYVIKKGTYNKTKPIRVRVISKNILRNKSIFKDKTVIASIKYLNKYNNFALIIIKDQKSIKQKISEQFKGNNILRYYGVGAQIIKDIGIKNMVLVSRSKKKLIGLEGFGIKIIKQEIIK